MKSFKHKETGKVFQFEHVEHGESVLGPPPHGGKDMVYGHKVYVGDVEGQGWRHAVILTSVAYVITDEMECDGRTWWVSEKWPISLQ